MRKERCALHAYALMTNHVHLLLTPERAAAIARVLIALGRPYVQYINTTYRRTGSLWDSRYESSLVQAEMYLLNCQRSIERNPFIKTYFDSDLVRWQVLPVQIPVQINVVNDREGSDVELTLDGLNPIDASGERRPLPGLDGVGDRSGRSDGGELPSA